MKQIDWVERAGKAHRRGDPNETERLLDLAIRKHPDNRAAWTLLMEVAYEKQEPLKFLRKLNAAPLTSRAERREIEQTFINYIAERDRAERKVMVRLNAQGQAIPVTGLEHVPQRRSFLYTFNLLMLLFLVVILFAASMHVWLVIALLGAAAMAALAACFYWLVLRKNGFSLGVLVTLGLGLFVLLLMGVFYFNIV